MNNSKALIIAIVVLLCVSVIFVAALVTSNSPEITANQAKAIALGLVDTTKGGTITDIEREEENGKLVYSVEFTNSDGETDVKIDVMTGKVLVIENDQSEIDGESDKMSNAQISLQEAQKIAVEKVGGTVTDSESKNINGREAWEIELQRDGQEADVLVDKATGQIIDIEWG